MTVASGKNQNNFWSLSKHFKTCQRDVLNPTLPGTLAKPRSFLSFSKVRFLSEVMPQVGQGLDFAFAFPPQAADIMAYLLSSLQGSLK